MPHPASNNSLLVAGDVNVICCVRDGGPISLQGDPQALDNPSDTVLADDVLRLFVRAGLGIDPGERPPQAARPRTGGGEADDDYFTDFRVLDKGDWNG